MKVNEIVIKNKINEPIKDGFYIEVTFMFGDADGYQTEEMGPFSKKELPLLYDVLETIQRCIDAYPNGRRGGDTYNHVEGFNEMTHVCSGSSYDMWQEAFANILLGKGIETKIEEIPERAFSMVGDVFLDIYGTPLGKDSGLVILYGERNGNRVLRFRCSDKSLKKAVPGKKSPLFPTINEVWSGVSVLAKPAFTTASGLTICDPVRILNQW